MTTPGYDDAPERTDLSGRQGMAGGQDPTTQPNQYTDTLFGQKLPQGTGAGGSTGASGTSDPTTQPGQTDPSKLVGVTEEQITHTGSPGTTGADEQSGGKSVTFTVPGTYLGGTNEQKTVTANVDGASGDWTQTVADHYTGKGNLPGIAGNSGLANTGSGSGSVLRGGRDHAGT